MYNYIDKISFKVSDIKQSENIVIIYNAKDNFYQVSLFKDNVNINNFEKPISTEGLIKDVIYSYKDKEIIKSSLYNSEREVIMSNVNNAKIYLPTKVIINVENILENKGVHFYIGENVWYLEFEDIHHHLCVLKENFLGYRGFKNKNIIKVRNLYTGELLWEIDITKLQEQFPIKYPVIKEFDPPQPQQENLHLELITHENLLIFSTSLQRTFAFNIQTGELVWRKENFGGELMIHENHLLQFFSLKLKAEIIDIFTGELVEEISYFDEFKTISKKNRTSVYYRHIIHEDSIIFVDNSGSIIFLNLKTKKIDWYTHFEHGGIRQYPVLQGDFMYILDDKNALHIFEKS